ncbi:hypothetical protein AJ80_07841 [Polytolypa hystricis UAMH7299]|uniref:CMP/dCMP-type deaminase domain-containing protein n=1 Tax=Polytolypa hystricis (strain UAMH7299) TaxID=1447883 RepID=A0A2B7XIB8_POLH7|nr:hypothetical protein AJ80_07841 [Polytolypa hystricis UAMH7299]
MTTTTTPPSSSPHISYLHKCLDLARLSPPKPTNFRVGAILVHRKKPTTTTTTTTTSPPPTTTTPIPTSTTDTILSTGYTLELPGNTHAEQCCLAKYAAQQGVSEEDVGRALLPGGKHPLDNNNSSDEVGEVVLYVTMEPCGKRLSGNTPCVQRIIRTRNNNNNNNNKSETGTDTSSGKKSGIIAGTRGISKVYFGVKEPGTFVGASEGCKMLDEAGIEWEVVPGLEEEILGVAMAGHKDKDNKQAREEGKGEGGGSRGTNVDDISPEERRRQEVLPRNPMKRMMEADI